MALIVADRVQETCNAPGTGVVTLLGAVTQFQTFSAAIGNANTTFYVIADQTGSNWEVGIGTYATTGNTLTRTTILASSNAGLVVNFASGTQNVWGDYPAGKAIYKDASGNAIGLGTPAAFVATNVTGLPLTTGVSGTLPVGNGGTGVTTSTGTGSTVLSISPTLVTPFLGTPTSGDLTNCTFPTLNQNTTGTATTATNVAGGVAGSIPYQTAASTTAMTAASTVAGQVLTTVTAGGAPTWVSPSAGGSTTKSWTAFTATGSYVVPAGITSIRAYAFGRGGNGGFGVSAGGGGGGCAFGDIAVTAGQTVSVSISSGVATVTYASTAMLTANPASGVNAGSASKNASVTNGGNYSGGAGGGSGGGGGGASGSPLGNGGTGGVSFGGGGGAGGAGAGGNGGGGGAGGAGGARGGGGSGGIANGYIGGVGRSTATAFTDPLMSACTGTGGSGSVVAGAYPASGGQGGGGGGNGITAGGGGNGGMFGGGGSGGGGGTGGVGGFGGGGGAGGFAGGAGGYGGGGGAGGDGGAGGAAIVLIYA